jgi:hypothetical protein
VTTQDQARFDPRPAHTSDSSARAELAAAIFNVSTLLPTSSSCRALLRCRNGIKDLAPDQDHQSARPAGKRPSIIAPIASYVSVKRRGSIIKIGNFAANFGVRRGVGELYIVHGQNQLAVTLRFPASVI